MRTETEQANRWPHHLDLASNHPQKTNSLCLWYFILNRIFRLFSFMTLALMLCLGLLSASSARAADLNARTNGLLEPTVSLFREVLPPHVCKELIDAGENEGFNVHAESIDDNVEGYKATGQSIDVYERNSGVQSTAVWNLLEPWIPKLTELVKSSIDSATDKYYFPDQPDRVPQLDWVFFRKYSPDSERNSLLLHVDSNMHTLNIALNDDFHGGGLFYVKPELAIQGEEETLFHIYSRPLISDQYCTYDWLNSIKRKNTSDIVFPTLGPGDVLIHNFTVWHAVAPLEIGTRYSFVLFYDMANPAIQGDFYDLISVDFYHEIEDLNIDLVWVDAKGGLETVHVIEEKIPPFMVSYHESYEGHVIRAMVSGRDTILAEFVMSKDQKIYTITKNNLSKDEL